MITVGVWTIIFSLTAAMATVLLGDRNLISGDLFNHRSLIRLIFHWKFIVSFFCSILSRCSFIMINNSLLKIESLSKNSTTITAYITTGAFIFVVIANMIFLKEKLSLQQASGALIIMIGIYIMLK